MTLYRIDGETLLADRHCPQGTQTRLQLTKAGGADKLSFVFRDGTKLQAEGTSHQQLFWIEPGTRLIRTQRDLCGERQHFDQICPFEAPVKRSLTLVLLLRAKSANRSFKPKPLRGSA